jgi:hypothetical protein
MLYFKYGSKLAIEQNQKEGNGIKYKEEKGKKTQDVDIDIDTARVPMSFHGCLSF